MQVYDAAAGVLSTDALDGRVTWWRAQEDAVADAALAGVPSVLADV